MSCPTQTLILRERKVDMEKERNELGSKDLLDLFPEADLRPKKGGWAPGHYTCRCCRCASRFTGDKRAWECADCAYNRPVINYQI
jgi:hypothetical protein